MVVTESWQTLVEALDRKCIIEAPFCGGKECEGEIKKDSTKEEAEPGAPAMGAKSLCIPFEQPKEMSKGLKCVHPKCGQAAKSYTLFGRSY